MPHREPPLRHRLRTRLASLQVGIVLVLVLGVAAVVMAFEDQRIQDAAYDRARTVALEVADEPDVIEALNTSRAVDTIAPLARLAQESSGVDYVVVVGLDDIRVAHPDEDRIGEPVSTDHSLIREGESFRGVERGTLGVTLRVKEPIYDGETVVGTISVGILQSKVRANLAGVVLSFAPWVIGAATAGTLLSLAVARSIRRRIYGVEPDEVAALLQSQNALLYSVRDGVVGVDSGGTISLLNAEAKRLLGVGDEALGAPASQVLTPLLGAETVAPASDRAGGEGAAELGPATQVLVGERVLVVQRRAAGAAAEDAPGGPGSAGYTLTLQDRTEVEATLRELAGQRSLADALRSQTHEFSNRLHVLSGYLSVGAVDEAAAYVRRIAPAVQPDLSGSTGSTAGSGLVSEPALAGILAANAAVAREAGVEFEVDPGSATPHGWEADDDAATVLANLITNALEAAGDGGRVRVLVRVTDGAYHVRVEDSGPGVAPEYAEHIFERGVSTKAGSEPRGIGLALVARIVERRGGTVQVGRADREPAGRATALATTTPLGGARFDIQWPLTEEGTR